MGAMARRWWRGPRRRRGSSAPRSTRDRSGRGPGSGRSPPARPSTGSRRASGRLAADLLADEATRRMLASRSRPDLDLEVRPARGHGGAAEAPDLIVGIAEPAGRRGVGGKPSAASPASRGGLRRASRLRISRACVRRQGVGDLREVDAGHELLRRHVDEELPERLAFLLAPRGPRRRSTTAPVAMWTMPFSGPSQRSCGSWVRLW